ncbi:uncharacterized protein ACRADG_001806 [Cochliomyia hominivorax]
MHLNDKSIYILIFLSVSKFKFSSSYGSVYTSYLGNKYYIELDRKYTFTEALIACMEMNLTLLAMDSHTKTKEINRIFEFDIGRNEKVWVDGIFSRYPQHHFVWLSTRKQFVYTDWDYNSPNFYDKDQFCVNIGHSNMEWNDEFCNFQHGFICEPDPLQQQFKEEIEKQKKQYEEKEIRYKKELENYQKQLKNETEKQQNMLKELQEKDKREKLMQEELKEKEKLEKETREKLQEREKFEKLLQKELSNLREILKEQEEIHLRDKDLRDHILDKKYRNITLQFYQFIIN